MTRHDIATEPAPVMSRESSAPSHQSSVVGRGARDVVEIARRSTANPMYPIAQWYGSAVGTFHGRYTPPDGSTEWIRPNSDSTPQMARIAVAGMMRRSMRNAAAEPQSNAVRMNPFASMI